MIFKNQSIVITGGASGIGLEVAKKVLSNNGTAVIIDRSKDATNNIKLDKNPISNAIRDHLKVSISFPDIIIIVPPEPKKE